MSRLNPHERVHGRRDVSNENAALPIHRSTAVGRHNATTRSRDERTRITLGTNNADAT
jgi:hypothetical protein